MARIIEISRDPEHVARVQAEIDQLEGWVAESRSHRVRDVLSGEIAGLREHIRPRVHLIEVQAVSSDGYVTLICDDCRQTCTLRGGRQDLERAYADPSWHSAC